MSVTAVRRLSLLAATAGLAIASAAVAQDRGYDPYAPGPYVQQPYAQQPYPQGPDGYAPGAYSQNPYPQGPYVQGPYAQGPEGQSPYDAGGYAPGPYVDSGYPPADPYAAQRRAWRRQQAQGPYQSGQPAPYRQAHAAPPPPAAYAPAAPAADAPPPAAPVAVARRAEAPAPRLAPPQSVALDSRVVESASAYLAYMRKASAISAAFNDGAGVAREVRTGAAYEPKQFEEGAIAYAAIVALQEPAFVEAVRAAGNGDPGRIQQIAADLMANPAAAVTFPGADLAAARAGAALRRQGDRLMEAGAKVKQSAYDVQHAAWSKGDVANPATRLAGAKILSATRLTPARAETEKLLKIVLAEQGAPGDPGDGAASPAVSRGLALAALAVLGQAGDGSAERLQPLMAEESGGQCLHMAKLNLFQCLAVAGPHYEDIFCLGQHAMMDTAQCVIKASGAARPTMSASAAVAPMAAAPSPTAATPAPQDYWVPTNAATVGSEAARR